MDNPVPIGCRTDLPLFGFVDEETAVGAGSVGFGREFLMQLPQVPFLIEVECGHGRAEAFAFAGLFGGTQQGLEADDLFPQIAVTFHALPLLLSQPPTSLPISSMALAAKP